MARIYALQRPCASCREGRDVAPTLIISARDDGYGTYANAEYLAPRIRGARFIGYATGGQMLVGHGREVETALLAHVLGNAR